MIIECKAKKIPFKVLSSPNPYLENEEVFDELINGVCQIWRYTADVRREAADASWSIGDDLIGVVLLLEPWFQMSFQTVEQITKAAEIRCAGAPLVGEQDRIAITFVAIDDWEYSLRQVGPDGILAALKEHVHPERFGYQLGSVVDEIASNFERPVESYDYSSSARRLVPWLKDLKEGRIPPAVDTLESERSDARNFLTASRWSQVVLDYSGSSVRLADSGPLTPQTSAQSPPTPRRPRHPSPVAR